VHETSHGALKECGCQRRHADDQYSHQEAYAPLLKGLIGKPFGAQVGHLGDQIRGPESSGDAQGELQDE
jgi:hypothetical protein